VRYERLAPITSTASRRRRTSRPAGCGPAITNARIWPWAVSPRNSGWPWPHRSTSGDHGNRGD
jgi:hypothetical protein